MSEQDPFFIKANYTPRLQPEYFFDDTGETVYQPHVYPLAASLGARFGCRYLIDIGCGTGGKLAQLHPRFEIIGIDYGGNLEQCRSRHPFGTWIEHDLESPEELDLPEEAVRQAVVICSDVIEHLVNPRFLLNKIKALLQHAPVCLLSTPERDLERGPDHEGPPQNRAHVREWNREELRQLLVHAGLNPVHVGLTVSNDADWSKKTILCALANGAGEPVASAVEEKLNELEQRNP